MTRLLEIDSEQFSEHFARDPFTVRHTLTEHPLLSVESLAKLADRIPAASVEHNRGDVPEVLAGDEAFSFKIAFDESLSRFSPGVQLEVAMVGEFHDRMPHARMDSCADSDNEMINRLWPDRRPLVSYAIPTSGATGWASARGVEAAFQVHNRLRRAS